MTILYRIVSKFDRGNTEIYQPQRLYGLTLFGHKIGIWWRFTGVTYSQQDMAMWDTQEACQKRIDDDKIAVLAARMNKGRGLNVVEVSTI